MVSGEAGTLAKLFPQEHIPNILNSVLEASSTLRKKTDRDREDSITRRLCARLVRIPTFRDGPLNIHPKQEILFSDLDANNAAGEIDILVSCGHGFEVYFALEAKRLRVRYPNGRLKSGNSEYVKDGMMRFVTGKYAPFMKASAMLGYVFDGQIVKARSGVDRAIQSKAVELKLKPPKQLTKSSILPKNVTHETYHDLGTRSFTIHHIFLAV